MKLYSLTKTTSNANALWKHFKFSLFTFALSVKLASKATQSVLSQQHHLAPTFTLPFMALLGWRARGRALSVPTRQWNREAVQTGAQRIEETHRVLHGFRQKRASRERMGFAYRDGRACTLTHTRYAAEPNAQTQVQDKAARAREHVNTGPVQEQITPRRVSSHHVLYVVPNGIYACTTSVVRVHK